MDDGDARVDLKLGEGVGDTDGDVVGVGGGAAEDGAETDNGFVGAGAGEAGGDGGNFEGAWDADDFGFVGGFEFCLGEADEGVGVFGVVASGDDGELAAEFLRGRRADFLEHGEGKWKRGGKFKRFRESELNKVSIFH